MTEELNNHELSTYDGMSDRETLLAVAHDIARLVEALTERDRRIAELEDLVPQAFEAGTAYAVGSHDDFVQIHPDREAWVRGAL